MSQSDEKKEELEEKDIERIMMCCQDDEAVDMLGKGRRKIVLRLGENLEGRGNVVMTRLNDDDLKQIDALVEVEAFKSRSEAVAFFIREGIQARKDLFGKVIPTVDKIRELKEQVKKSIETK